MIGALVLSLLMTGPVDGLDADKDCEVEACSATTLRALWLAERTAREEWEKTAAAHDLVNKALRPAIIDLGRTIEAMRNARLAEAAPAADSAMPTSCLWLAGGAFVAGAAAGVGGAVIVTNFTEDK